MGTSGGEVIVATTDGRPIKRFNAHKGFVIILFCKLEYFLMFL